jgi:hypothetical protein
MVQGIELRVSHMQGRHSTTWATPPVPFYFIYISDRVLCFYPGPTLEHEPYIYISYLAWSTGTHQPCLACWLSGDLINFLSQLASNQGLLDLHIH